MVSEVNFTARDYPCQKCFKGRFGNLVKFTFRPYPLYNVLRGTLVSEVNFTGRVNPCQKHLWSRLGRLCPFAEVS